MHSVFSMAGSLGDGHRNRKSQKSLRFRVGLSPISTLVPITSWLEAIKFSLAGEKSNKFPSSFSQTLHLIGKLASLRENESYCQGKTIPQREKLTFPSEGNSPNFPLEGKFVPQIDSVNIWCIVFFPVLKPLACGRRWRCLGWTYKLPGGQKFRIKLSPFSVGFPQRRPLNLIKRPRLISSPGCDL